MSEPCPACGGVVDDHTVKGLRECLSDVHDHTMKFENIPITNQDVEAFWAGSVAVKAGVRETAIGVFPVLVFSFTGPEGVLHDIALLLDDTHMRDVRRLVGDAAEAAIKGARKRRH